MAMQDGNANFPSNNPDEQRKPTENAHYVLDDGALLHRVPWPRGSTYDKICQLYIKYVTQKYGAASVVFDGYCDGPTIKDAAHLRRTWFCAGVTVNFSCGMVLQSKQEDFLKNPTNKTCFIGFLSEALQQAGCKFFSG